MSCFPFSHLTLAEVAEFDRIVSERRPDGGMKSGTAVRFARLAARRHPPIYRDDEPEVAA